MEDVFSDISDFFSGGAHEKELVILKISHCADGSSSEPNAECNSSDFDLIKKHIKNDLPRLVKCSDDCDLMDMTLNEIFEKGNVIALVDGVSSDKADGIFSWSDNDLPIYDHYSNADDLDAMAADQYDKLTTQDNHKNKLFLLSWTLTMSESDALACATNTTTILSMALDARKALFPKVIGDWLEKGFITQQIYPNILYVDAYDQVATRAAIYLNLFDDRIVLWHSNTDGHPGAYYTMQDDGNFVVYTAFEKKALWASGTDGHPDATLVMQDFDGNLVIYDTDGKALWASGTQGHPGATLVMQDFDGNLVIYDTDGKALWSTHTQGNPGAWYTMQDDGNLVVYKDIGDKALWATGTDGNPGADCRMQGDGNFVIYSADKQPLWSSHTSGHPGATLEMLDTGDLQILSMPWTR